MLIFTISKTIDEIPKETWEDLFGKEIIENYGYHKTLEEANLKEFNIFYLVGRRKENIVAIIPFFTMDFSLTTLIRGRIQKIIFFIRKFLKKILKIRILFIGAPITEELYIGVSKEENLENIFDAALNKIEEFCKKEKIKIIAFYNLSKKHIALIDYLKRKKFIEMENFPNTLIEIKANNLENYIKNLSRGTRKDIKRKIKKVSKLVKLETILYTKIDHIIDEIYKLYLNNKNASDLQFENLTPEFFINISKNMPQETKWFITKEKEKIVAFNLCFVKNNFCIDKFIGLDYSVAFKYNLYFMTFLNNIDWCIKNNIKYYQLGQSDYEPKLRLGANLIPLYLYIKTTSIFLNFILKPTLKIIEPKNFDPVLKRIKLFS